MTLGVPWGYFPTECAGENEKNANEGVVTIMIYVFQVCVGGNLMKRSSVGTTAMLLVALVCLSGSHVKAQSANYPAQGPYGAPQAYTAQQAYAAPQAYTAQQAYAAAPAYYEALAGQGGQGYKAALAGYDAAPVAFASGGCTSCGGGDSAAAGCSTCGNGQNEACPSCGGGNKCGHCKARLGGGLFGPGGGGGLFGHGGKRLLGNFARNNGRGLWTKHGPNGTGANCTPRWFDFDAEIMLLKRENVSRQIAYASNGIAGPTVLSTDNLDFGTAPGFRITGNYLLGPGTNLEASYFGSFNWSTAAAVTSGNNSLYSLLSDFGTNPNGGFPETDASVSQSLSYSSALNSVEMNVRRRYVSPNCRFHSSLLAGARYIVLDESMQYFTDSGSQVNGSMDYRTDTSAQMVGFQIGGELIMAVIPRVRIGAEIKAGVFGTINEQSTNITLTGPNAAVFSESQNNNDVGAVGEAGFFALVQATERLTIRAGYQMLYLNGVALAVENINPDTTFLGGARTSRLNESGSVFYHGFSGGMEWTW